MRKPSGQQLPVGVIPRRQVRSIESLMGDGPAGCTVADDVEPCPHRSFQPLARSWARSWARSRARWLPSAVTFTAVAGILEWLKLTR